MTHLKINKIKHLFFFLFKKKRSFNSMSSNSAEPLNQDYLERLVCYTLATLTYLEGLIQKLNILIKLFPYDSNLFIQYLFEYACIFILILLLLFFLSGRVCD